MPPSHNSEAGLPGDTVARPGCTSVAVRCFWEGLDLLLMTVRGRLVLVDHRHPKTMAGVLLPGYRWQSTIGSEDPGLFAVRRIAGCRFVTDHERRVDNTIWAIPLEEQGR